MIKCNLCEKTFKNNLGGHLTIHLLSDHCLSFEDYIVKTEYNDIAPVCKCGLCDERPVFTRGRFLSYSKNHNKFKVREKLYVEKYGSPLCKTCNKEVKFSRGNPQQFCSHKCSGKQCGFSLTRVQESIKRNVKEKYGVDNISKTTFVRERIRKAKLGTKYRKSSPESNIRKSIATKLRWENEEYRNIMKNIVFSAEEKQKRSERLKLQNKDPKFRELGFANSKNRLSKLHVKIRSILDLQNMGFVSEKRIDKYFIDEYHEDYKLCIEINGNYIHANPKLYESSYNIRLRGNSYLASKKWKDDNRKIDFLVKLGYHVIVIWEDDDLVEKKKEILNFISSCK